MNGEAADDPPPNAAPPAGTGAPAPRLQKVLAAAGVASRRKCETLMAEGRVEVDGTFVTQLGARVDPESAVIRVDGRRIPVAHRHVYLVANKPRGVVSSMADESGRPDLSGLLGERPERLFHVGRLDTDTDGLIVLTNDGEFAHRLAHPSYELQKTYVAHVEGVVRPAAGASLLAGVDLDDGPVTVDAFKVTLTQPGAAGQPGRSIVEVVLHEGRNRIVRRLLAAVGHPVLRLTRTAIGPIRLHGLPTGQVRELTADELGTLLDAVGL